jgi:DNA repair protein RAD50
MKKASPASVKTNTDETAEWEAELDRLQNLRPVLTTRDQLQTKDIPTLEADVKKKEAAINDATAALDLACFITQVPQLFLLMCSFRPLRSLTRRKTL